MTSGEMQAHNKTNNHTVVLLFIILSTIPPLHAFGGIPPRSMRPFSYGIANTLDLSQRWRQLVEDGKVAVTTAIPNCDDDPSSEPIGVRYGVRLCGNHHQEEQEGPQYMEFVEPAPNSDEMHPRIARLNATLAASGGGVQFRRDGTFCAQLQLVRTLRPPPSPGFGGGTASTTHKSSATPPPYHGDSDSFVTGPLRLDLRPRVAQLSSSRLSIPWDVYHNVSPADVRGHFLLLPTLDDATKRNWRGQALLPSDCDDMVQLAATIQPRGSLLLCFNSVGAGASQNHIHCHLWPSPPVPLMLLTEPIQPVDELEEEEEEAKIEFNNDEGHDHTHGHQERSAEQQHDMELHGWSSYAVSKAMAIYDFVDIHDENTTSIVEVSYLDYPCFTVQLSSANYKLLPRALATTLDSIGDAPHNVCLLNRPADAEDSNNNNQDLPNTSSEVDVYVFVRSRERSPNVVTATKLGASEMMGVFHCQSLEQLEELVPAEGTQQRYLSPMAQALEDVSHENPEQLWDTIKQRLEEMSWSQ